MGDVVKIGEYFGVVEATLRTTHLSDSTGTTS